MYFITICTKKYFFGEIKNEIMGLNILGCIAHHFWEEIPKYFEYVILDEFVVMPNHIHGILHITQKLENVGAISNRPYGDISQIIKGYKSSVTKSINNLVTEKKISKIYFDWQKSFYDHIIRNEKELHNIRKYIRYNPAKWETDIENKKWNKSFEKKKYYENIFCNEM